MLPPARPRTRIEGVFNCSRMVVVVSCSAQPTVPFQREEDKHFLRAEREPLSTGSLVRL